MSTVNQELEGQTARWCGNCGTWDEGDGCNCPPEYDPPLTRDQNAEQARGMDSSRNAVAAQTDSLGVSRQNASSDSEDISTIHRMSSASRSGLTLDQTEATCAVIDEQKRNEDEAEWQAVLEAEYQQRLLQEETDHASD